MQAKTSHPTPIQVSGPVVWHGVRLTGVQRCTVPFSSESTLSRAPTVTLLEFAEAAPESRCSRTPTAVSCSYLVIQPVCKAAGFKGEIPLMIVLNEQSIILLCGV